MTSGSGTTADIIRHYYFYLIFHKSHVVQSSHQAARSINLCVCITNYVIVDSAMPIAILSM